MRLKFRFKVRHLCFLFGIMVLCMFIVIASSVYVMTRKEKVSTNRQTIDAQSIAPIGTENSRKYSHHDMHGIEKSSIVNHLVFDAESSLIACSEFGTFHNETNARLIEDEERVIQLSVSRNRSKRLEVCLAKHFHPHSIELASVSKDTSKPCMIYVSATFAVPSKSNWDWKITPSSSNSLLGSSIVLSTVMKEFAAGLGDETYNMLVIGVFGEYDTEVTCEARLKIKPISMAELAKRSPALRGQVLLPRDVEKLTSGLA